MQLSEEAGPALVTELSSGPQGPGGQETILFQKEGRFTVAALSPGGDRLALSEERGPVTVYELPSGDLLQTVPLDDQLLATSLAFNNDGSILLWDLVNFEPANDQPAGLPLARHKNAVTSLAFSPDGKRLASGSRDNSLILWDFETRLPLGSPLLGAQLGVTALAFGDEGALLAGYEDGILLEWDVRVERWMEIACGLAGERLSEEEQKQYFPGGGYRDICGG